MAEWGSTAQKDLQTLYDRLFPDVPAKVYKPYVDPGRPFSVKKRWVIERSEDDIEIIGTTTYDARQAIKAKYRRRQKDAAKGS